MLGLIGVSIFFLMALVWAIWTTVKIFEVIQKFDREDKD